MTKDLCASRRVACGRLPLSVASGEINYQYLVQFSVVKIRIAAVRASIGEKSGLKLVRRKGKQRKRRWSVCSIRVVFREQS